MTHWKEVITDDFDAGYSAIAEDMAVNIWDMPLAEIYAKYTKEIAEQCETLLTKVLVEALKTEEQEAIDNYKQSVMLSALQQKEN